MKIIEITNENVAVFEDLIGMDLAYDMDRSFFRGLGAVDEDDAPKGALIYELKGADSSVPTQSEIRLLTADSAETKKVLLENYQSFAEEDDVKMSSYETEDGETAGLFSSMGFSRMQIESRRIIVPLADLEKMPLNRLVKVPDYVVSLSEVTIVQFRNMVKKVILNGNKGILEDLAYLPINWYEKEVSTCCISDGNLDGMLLVRKTPSGELQALLYTAYGPDFVRNLGYMLVQGTNKALELYPPETKVSIVRYNKDVMALASRIAAGHRGAEGFFGERNEG